MIVFSMKKKFIGVFFILILICFFTEAIAQCPMCKMAAESNLRHGGSAGKGLNMGILYMLLTPYLLVGGLAYWWIRNKKKLSD